MYIYFCPPNSFAQSYQDTSSDSDYLYKALGIVTADVTEQDANIFGMNESNGIRVTEVLTNSLAEKAGLHGDEVKFRYGRERVLFGDVILQVENETIYDQENLINMMRNTVIGDSIHMNIFRDGQIKSLDVVIGPSGEYYNASLFSTPDKIEFEPYSNFDLEMGISYPPQWEINEDVQSTEDAIMGRVVEIRSPFENANDTSRERLLVQTYSKYDDIDDIDGACEEASWKNFTSGHLNNITTSCKELGKLIKVKSSNITVSNNSARQLVYDFPVEGKKLLEVFFVEKGKPYKLSFLADKSKFNSYLPTINQMIASFTVIPNVSYESFADGIMMKYPSSLSPKKPTFDELMMIDDLDAVAVFRNQNNNFSIPQKFVISVSQPNPSEPIAQGISRTLKYYETLDKDNFRLINSNLTTLKNVQPYYNITYSHGDPYYRTVISTHLITAWNDRIYTFSYSEPRENYSKASHILNKAIDSVQFFSTVPIVDPKLGIMLQYPFPIMKELERTNTTIKLSPHLSSDDSAFTLTVSNSSNQVNTRLSFDEAKSHETGEFLNTTSGTRLNATKSIFTARDPIYHQEYPTLLQINSSLRNNLDNNTYSYDIEFNAQPEDYDGYISTIENIISSIKIVDYPAIITNFSNHVFSDYGFEIKYPQNWEYEYGSGAVTLRQSDDTLPETSTTEVNLDSPPPNLYVSVLPLDNVSMFEQVKTDIEYFPQVFSDFRLIDSTINEEDGHPKYTIQYTYYDENYDENLMTMSWYVQNVINSNLYVLSYTATVNEFYGVLPMIEEMISSVDLLPSSNKRTLTGFKTGDFPTGVATNRYTNTIYVANQLSNTISVINGSNDQMLTDIRVKGEPWTVAVNEIKNIIYVTHPGSVSVIDGRNNTLISSIKTGAESPISMAINQATNRIYIADDISKEVTVIDSRNNTRIDVISTVDLSNYNLESLSNYNLESNSGSGVSVSVDHLRNRIYVVNNLDGNITAIDGKDNSIISKIPIGMFPGNSSEISVNPYTNKAYLTFYGTEIIETDLSSRESKSLNASGVAFNTIALNPFTNDVYVTDSSSNVVFAIDPILKNSTRIAVDLSPVYLSVNPNTNVVYVTNSGSNTISKIDGSTNSLLYGVRFKINPPNSAVIFCNSSGNTMELYDNDYVVYNNGTSVKCEAKSRDVFSPLLSASWSGLDSRAPIGFSVTEYGVLSGSFLDFTTLIQRLGPFISLVVLITVVLVASFPTLLGKFRKFSDFVKEEKLTRTEIVGIDASIIVGVLFFLTISEGFELSEQTQITIVTANIIFPFAISAILAIIKHNKEYATRLMIAGFINLIISVILISIMRL